MLKRYVHATEVFGSDLVHYIDLDALEWHGSILAVKDEGSSPLLCGQEFTAGRLTSREVTCIHCVLGFHELNALVDRWLTDVEVRPVPVPAGAPV